MIFDLVSNSTAYKLPDIFYKAIEHSLSLTADSLDGVTLLEDGLKASVSTYATKVLEEAKAETHRKYIDLQIAITGMERIHSFEYGVLPVSEPYDAERDFEFYDASECAPDASLILRPGSFVVFFPWDVHMPAVAVDFPERMKKVVYKIPADVLNG